MLMKIYVAELLKYYHHYTDIGISIWLTLLPEAHVKHIVSYAVVISFSLPPFHQFWGSGYWGCRG